jgi:hypothetical protein
MPGSKDLRSRLGAALRGVEDGVLAADRLCEACVDLLHVDGAAISLIHDGATRGTYGSSGELSRHLDELQFTFGEGPCLDAVSAGSPVEAADLGDPQELRWPAFRAGALASGVRAVFAAPVRVSTSVVGALDLFRCDEGPFTGDSYSGGLMAAELAALPLIDLMLTTTALVQDGAIDGGDGWEQLASLERVEVYQATGMLIAALDIDGAEALTRLRAHAFSAGMTASELAWEIVERRVVVDRDGSWRRHDGGRSDG